MKIILIILIVIISIPVLGWLGLKVKPRPFPPYPERTPEMATVPLPEGLPAPVERFFRTTLGDEVPVIDSAVITTTADLRFMGITFPSTFRFTHDAGRGYRHYIESAVFGVPLLRVNERYLDGAGVMELPVGTIENEPKIDSAANMGLWGESVWLPSIFLTDERVRWEAVDDTTALLYVPFGGEEQVFTVMFDADTALITRLETMRWKAPDSETQTRWILEPYGWQAFNGILIPSPAAVTWEDEGTPWLVVRIEDVVYNVDVSAYIRGRGL